jgi:4a-hydroxytetrahydrobiopterin dehydratase
VGDDATQVYGEDELAVALAASLPRWEAEDGGRRIMRRFAVTGWKGAVMVLGAVGHLAEAAWHHPEVRASYGWVEVRVWSHDAGGVTGRDLALAAKIEDVVAWRPGEEDGPLTGPPDDPRFSYVLPD